MTEQLCIELQSISVTLGQTVALDRLSLEIPAGQCVALVGPSGAGKSTLISVMNATVAPNIGTLRLFGSAHDGLSRSQRRVLRTRVGTIHQDLHLPGSLRVVHNVNAGHLGEWSTLKALASLVRPQALEQVRSTLAMLGIEHLLWRRTDELSGGERQRVALARLLVQGAELLLADEPTASLDPARANDVVSAFTDSARRNGSTLVISLHSFDLARQYCDRLVGLRQGRIVFDLPAADIDEAMVEQLYQLQPSQ